MSAEEQRKITAWQDRQAHSQRIGMLGAYAAAHGLTTADAAMMHERFGAECPISGDHLTRHANPLRPHGKHRGDA